MLALGALAVLSLKLAAYTGWCWLGLRLLAPPGPRARRALLLGLLRMGLGLGLGWLMVLAFTVLAPQQNRLGVSVPALLIGFVLLRWLEWSFVGAVMTRNANRPSVILLGTGPKEHLWRAGGLAVSFATDLAGVFGVGALGAIPC